VIALALREALETPQRTAALVTPDRDLARRVRRRAAALGHRDRRLGRPAAADTPPAALLRRWSRAIDSGFAPIDLLALLKHPLCTWDCRAPHCSSGAPARSQVPARPQARARPRALRAGRAATFGGQADRQRVLDLVDA
jgi:ATP-dependent helicase/nuclease subunit B